jgi:hypothetical protein
MAERVDVPCATILTANFARCLNWSCHNCRSFALDREPGGDCGGGGDNSDGGTPGRRRSRSRSRDGDSSSNSATSISTSASSSTIDRSARPPSRRHSARYRCRLCCVSGPGRVNFFINLSLDIEGLYMQAVMGDEHVEELVGCTAAQWATMHGDGSGSSGVRVGGVVAGVIAGGGGRADGGAGLGGPGGGSSSVVAASAVGLALRGTVCALVLELPRSSKRGGGLHDPKIIACTPRAPFRPFYDLLSRERVGSNATAAGLADAGSAESRGAAGGGGGGRIRAEGNVATCR